MAAEANQGTWNTDQCIRDRQFYTSVQFLVNELYNNKTLSCSDKKHLEDALDSLKLVNAYTEVEDRMKKVWNDLIAEGNEYTNYDQFDSAIIAFSKAIALDPDQTLGYFNRACVYYNMGYSRLTIEDCYEVLNRNPNSVGSFLLLGSAYTAIQDYPAALENFRNAYHLEPTPAHLSNVRLIEKYIQDLEKKQKHANIVAQFNARLLGEDIQYWKKVINELTSYVRAQPKSLDLVVDTEQHFQHFRSVMTLRLKEYFMQYSSELSEVCEQYASNSVRRLFSTDSGIPSDTGSNYNLTQYEHGMSNLQTRIKNKNVFSSLGYWWQHQLPLQLEKWASREFETVFLPSEGKSNPKSSTATNGTSEPVKSSTQISMVPNSIASRNPYLKVVPPEGNLNFSKNWRLISNSMAPNWNFDQCVMVMIRNMVEDLVSESKNSEIITSATASTTNTNTISTNATSESFLQQNLSNFSKATNQVSYCPARIDIPQMVEEAISTSNAAKKTTNTIFQFGSANEIPKPNRSFFFSSFSGETPQHFIEQPIVEFSPSSSDPVPSVLDLSPFSSTNSKSSSLSSFSSMKPHRCNTPEESSVSSFESSIFKAKCDLLNHNEDLNLDSDSKLNQLVPVEGEVNLPGMVQSMHLGSGFSILPDLAPPKPPLKSGAKCTSDELPTAVYLSTTSTLGPVVTTSQIGGSQLNVVNAGNVSSSMSSCVQTKSGQDSPTTTSKSSKSKDSDSDYEVIDNFSN